MSAFALEDFCETVLAVPANVAVLRAEANDCFVVAGMSPGLESLYKLEPGDSIGMEVDDFKYGRTTRRKLKEAYVRCRDSRTAVTMEEELPTPVGDWIWTSRTVAPLFDDSGAVIAVVSTVIDITELVMTRKAMAESLSAVASGFVTICAWCQNVKESSSWTPLDDYVRDHTQSGFSLCPSCSTAKTESL